MSKGVTKGKKLILASVDLVTKLMKISNKEGKTFYNFTSEIFEQALRVQEMNQSLQEVVDFFELMEIQRAAGAVIIPVDILTYIINSLYASDKEAFQEKWYESGQWYGKYLTSKFHDRNPVKAFGDLLAVSRWDLNEVSVAEEDGGVRMRCVSPLLPKENTEVLLKFIEGVMDSLGYKTKNKDYLKGIILLEFEGNKKSLKDEKIQEKEKSEKS